MTNEPFIQIQPLEGTFNVRPGFLREAIAASGTAKSARSTSAARPANLSSFPRKVSYSPKPMNGTIRNRQRKSWIF